MASDSTELFMMFIDINGKPVAGQSQTVLKKPLIGGNDLLTGFNQGYYFEVDTFSFGASNTGSQTDPTLSRLASQAAKDGNPLGQYLDHQQRTQATQTNGPQKPDIHDIQFSRLIDSASPIMLQNLIDRTFYQSASLIKRKAAGGTAAGDAFLRFDFNWILLTKIGWTDGDQVKESCSFICREVKMQYRPQLPDGSLGGPVPGYYAYQQS